MLNYYITSYLTIITLMSKMHKSVAVQFKVLLYIILMKIMPPERWGSTLTIKLNFDYRTDSKRRGYDKTELSA